MKASNSKYGPASSLARRVAVFLLFGMVLGAGVAFSFANVREPWYRTRLTLRVGEFGFFNQAGDLEVRSFERPVELAERLILSFGEPEEGGDRRPYLHRALVSHGESNLVNLEARSETAAGGTTFVRGIVDKVLREHDRILNRANELVAARHDTILDSLAVIDGALPASVNQGGESDSLAALVETQRGLLASEQARVGHELYLLELARFYTNASRLHAPPKSEDGLSGAFTGSQLIFSGGLVGALMGLIAALGLGSANSED